MATVTVEKQFKDAVNLQARKLGVKVLAGLISRTPVDEGRLKGNWQVGIDYAPTGELDTTDKAGTATNAKGGVIIRRFDIANNNSIFFVNNLKYAEPIENGHGGRAPGVMVEATLRRLQLK